jgi:DMSO/TMAO reductase YedYZ molybdopterin-dependent catalytic subunit
MAFDDKNKPDRSLLAPTREIVRLERRLFLRQSLSLGALTLLSGCDVTDQDGVQKVLWSMSRWNDRVQAAIFDLNKLAPTYPQSAITQPFPFNAFYPEAKAPRVDATTYKLELSGLVRDKAPWTLDRLYALPQTSQITRHICVEGWSAIGKWTGVTFKSLLEQVGADLTAKYVGFKCADDYYTSIDMPTALHPQTQLTFKFADQILPTAYGFPMKLRIPTKLGFKNPKHITAMFVTNDYPGGYWEDQGYNWFSGS